VIAASALAGCSLGDDPSSPPQIGAGSDSPAAKLGFPGSATKNTIRVGGGDAIADVAGVVNAVFPAESESTRPNAVVLVDKDDWQAGVTASVLMSKPLEAPILVSDGDQLPDVSEDTLQRLNPRGSDLSKDAQVIRIGERPPRPANAKTAVIQGDDPYERAAAIDRFAAVAKGEPSNDVVVASGEEADYAMPAAAWAARSGDSVLLVSRESVPAATRKALEEHEKPNIFLLGPRSVIGSAVERQLRELGRVRRIQGPNPVENAISFARYEQGDFGWGVTVPGYNFTVANTSRPLDAAAAAPLAGKGVFAPLLLTDDEERLPRQLESYFLDVQPGFEDDPGQAVYNRVWILGDTKEVSLAAQDRLDQIAELIPVETNAP